MQTPPCVLKGPMGRDLPGDHRRGHLAATGYTTVAVQGLDSWQFRRHARFAVGRTWREEF